MDAEETEQFDAFIANVEAGLEAAAYLRQCYRGVETLEAFFTVAQMNTSEAPELLSLDDDEEEPLC